MSDLSQVKRKLVTIKCRTCRGGGKFYSGALVWKICPRCNGAGRVPKVPTNPDVPVYPRKDEVKVTRK